jgi:hypothetical protein
MRSATSGDALSMSGAPLVSSLIFVAEDPVTVRMRVRLRRGG